MSNDAKAPHLAAVNLPSREASDHHLSKADPLKLVTRDFVLEGESLAVNFEHERMTSIISASTRSKGNIVSSEGYRVDGHHEGDIEATTIFVTERGYVHGKLTANRVIVQGTVSGEIKAMKELILASTSEVSGKVTYKDMVSFRGHRIEGALHRLK